MGTTDTRTIDPDAWISVGQLAEAACTNRRRVYALIADGRLRHSRPTPYSVRVRLADWRALHDGAVVEARTTARREAAIAALGRASCACSATPTPPNPETEE